MSEENDDRLVEWWQSHSEKLALRMNMSGIGSFTLALNEKGTYEFVITPEKQHMEMLKKERDKK